MVFIDCAHDTALEELPCFSIMDDIGQGISAMLGRGDPMGQPLSRIRERQMSEIQYWLEEVELREGGNIGRLAQASFNGRSAIVLLRRNKIQNTCKALCSHCALLQEDWV